MHILLITQYWEPEQGVVQRRWQWISKAIIEAGHELTVVCPPPHYPGGKLISDHPAHQTGAVDNSVEGIHVYRTRFREHGTSLISRIEDQAVTMLSQLRKAHRATRDAKAVGQPIDVICCTVPALPSAVVGFIASRLLRLPLVIELRDAWPEILEYLDEWKDPQPGNLPLSRRLKIAAFHRCLVRGGGALKQILRRADAIITTTESLAELKKGDSHGEVIAVRNRAHSEEIGRVPSSRQRLDGPLHVLYAGTVGRAQGLENAMEALAIAVEMGTDIRMRIAGGGAHLRSVQQIAYTKGLPVQFLGRIPFEDVVREYAWSDTVLVHLQSWTPMNYTIPSKLFEAMHAEKHISASLSGEAADIVRTAGVGDVVNPMNPNALAKLWHELWRDRDRLNVAGRGVDWFERDHARHDLAATWIRTVERASER